MYYLLRQSLEQRVTFFVAVWESVRACWQPVKFPKNSFITKTGQAEHYFYFILSGVQRLYYLTPAGREMTLGFT